MKGVTIFDYDQKIVDPLVTFSQTVWPIRSIAVHSCCPSSILLRLIVPVLRGLVNRWFRVRVQIHDIPGSEIAIALAEYGIKRDMLPTELGGTLELNPCEWIARRRAIEMEELS